MVNTSIKTASAQLTVSEFGGIDSNGRVDSGTAKMRNFRILADGSLEKRCGYRSEYSLNGPIRGVWEGTMDRTSYLFIVGGSTVYRKGPNDSLPVAVYYLSTDMAPVSFLYYRDQLYLFDGASLVIYRPALRTFIVAEGYTPLYGSYWHPTAMGEVNEPLNLIQNRIRIHYLNTVASTVFRLPFSVKRIDRLLINGVTVSNFSFTEGSSSFTIPTEQTVHREVEVAVTLDSAYDQRPTVLKSCHAALYSDPYRETAFLFGSIPYLAHCSGKVTDGMVAESARFYINSDPLYFPEGKSFAVGSTQHPITEIRQYNDQMLIFNNRSIWTVRYPSSVSDEPEISLLHTGLGCSSTRGTTACNDGIATVHMAGISLFRSPPNQPNNLIITSISEPVLQDMDWDFFKTLQLYVNRRENQLMAFNPKDPQHRVWIYDLTHERWFCYDSIPANRFFELEHQLSFSTDNGMIGCFDEGQEYDGTQRITAYYQSHYLESLIPDGFKRALRVSLCADTGSAPLTLDLETESAKKSFVLNGLGGKAPDLFCRRAAMGRFRFLRYRIHSDSVERCRIHFITVAAGN